MKSVIMVCFIVLGLVSSASAKETLRVLFLFDKYTTNYSNYQKKQISNKLFKNLRNSFIESDLLSTIDFKNVGFGTTDVSRRGTYRSIKAVTSYYRSNSINTIKTRKPKRLLHFYQKAYKADLVVTILHTRGTCGGTAFLPNKNTFSSKSKSFEFADGGLIFLNNSYSCLNLPSLLAHEVGHTFGLWHGKEVQEKTGDSGHYEPSIAFAKYANGYGHSDYLFEYGTIMAASY